MYLDLLLAGFALLSSASAADIYAKTSGVLQIEASNYDRLIAKSNYTSIVEFYAPWSGFYKICEPCVVAITNKQYIGADIAKTSPLHTPKPLHP